MQDLILGFFLFVLIAVILWFTYTIINIIVTILKVKKIDHSLKFCFNTKGKVFYVVMTILFIAIYFGGIALAVYGFLCDSATMVQWGLAFSALIAIGYTFSISSIVLIGRKNMMVGRMQIDYRKLKKVNYTYNKMSFVYAQHDYNFSIRFIDITQLRKMIAK